jgi:hypothetical protein
MLKFLLSLIPWDPQYNNVQTLKNFLIDFFYHEVPYNKIQKK